MDILLLTFPDKLLTVRSSISRSTNTTTTAEVASIETGTCCNRTNRAWASQLSTTAHTVAVHTKHRAACSSWMLRWCAAAYTDTVGSPFHKTFRCNPLDSSSSDSCCYRNLHSDRNTRLSLSIVVSTLYEDLHTYMQLYKWTQEAYIKDTLFPYISYH